MLTANSLLRVTHCFSRSPPLTSTIAIAHAGQCVFRLHLGIETLCDPPLVRGRIARISTAIASEPREVCVVQDAPPAGIAAEEGNVASPTDESVDVVAHALAPVLVVSDRQQE